MIQKIKILLVSMALSLGLGAPALLMPAVAYGNTITDNVCQGSNDAANNGATSGCNVTGAGSGENIKSIANQVVKIFSLIVGAVSIIMIIYGGFRYITSGGDSGRFGNAKNTLIYAVIGLIIVALSQFLVHYVLTTTGNISTA